jgi:hypothetical protein
MAVTAKAYSNMPINALKALIADLNSAGTAVKVALVTSSYTFNQETHNDFADITNEVTGTGYTAGGATLANKAVTETTRVTKFDADDVSWTSSTITARGAVIYYSTGTAGTSVLLIFVDFGEDKSSESGTFQITWNASGIFTITVAA